MLSKIEARAFEYRAMAVAAAAAAEVSVLEHVRQQYEGAAAVWRGLAEDQEQRAAKLRKYQWSPSPRAR